MVRHLLERKMQTGHLFSFSKNCNYIHRKGIATSKIKMSMTKYVTIVACLIILEIPFVGLV